MQPADRLRKCPIKSVTQMIEGNKFANSSNEVRTYMKMKLPRRLSVVVSAMAIGCLAAFLPWMATDLPESGVGGALRVAVNCLGLPGAVVGLIAYRNVHSISLWFVQLCNAIFYFGLFYFLFTAWAKHKAKSAARLGS